MKNYKIAVAGTGYVGLSIATLLSQHHQVTAVDIVPEKVKMINNRKSPIQDDYIEKYLAEKELNLTAKQLRRCLKNKYSRWFYRMMKKILNSNIIWSIVAILVNTAINFCVVPYVSENVGVEAYGFVTLANTLITYIDVLSLIHISEPTRH